MKTPIEIWNETFDNRPTQDMSWAKMLEQLQIVTDTYLRQTKPAEFCPLQHYMDKIIRDAVWESEEKRKYMFRVKEPFSKYVIGSHQKMEDTYFGIPFEPLSRNEVVVEWQDLDAKNPFIQLIAGIDYIFADDHYSIRIINPIYFDVGDTIIISRK